MINLTILKNKLTDMYGELPMMHMPYIFNVNNNKIFLFTVNINGFWKLHVYKNSKISRVDLGNADDINECNAYIQNEDGIYKFYYTHNEFYKNKMVLKSYELKDFLFNKNSFINEKIIDVDNANVYYQDQVATIAIPYCATYFKYIRPYFINQLMHIMCIRPVFNQKNILFTLVPLDERFNNNVSTVLFDTTCNLFRYIKLKKGDSIYKCSIDPENGDLYYAVRIGKDFEDRTIEAVSKKDYIFMDTNIILK